jgi:hypothetical protein
MRFLSEEWNSLPEDLKAPYRLMQDQDKARNLEERKQIESNAAIAGGSGKKKKKNSGEASTRKTFGITSFMLFVKMKRQEILQGIPKIRQEEITTLCGTYWKQLDEKTKAEYKALADKYNLAKKNGLDPSTVLVGVNISNLTGQK